MQPILRNPVDVLPISPKEIMPPPEKLVRKGSKGPVVRYIQFALNVGRDPKALIRADGQCGTATEYAVMEFQKTRSLRVDGVVGKDTWKHLVGQATQKKFIHLQKFAASVGTSEDVIRYLQKFQTSATSNRDFMASSVMTDFHRTVNGVRFVLISKKPWIIDFRHFFASAALSFTGHAKSINPGPGQGHALALGLANELAQCAEESVRFDMNSCFSPEDLGSNRLGAEFGELLQIRQAEADERRVYELLRSYLVRLNPVPPRLLPTVHLPKAVDQAEESGIAILVKFWDFLLPSAY